MHSGQNLERKIINSGVKKKQLAKLLSVHPNTITLWLQKEDLSEQIVRRVESELQRFTQKSIAYEEETINNQIQEPMSNYNSPKDLKSMKRLDAKSYVGKLKTLGDGLSLQKKWRSEW